MNGIRGPTYSTTFLTLSTDPIIYASSNSSLKSIDVFGTTIDTFNMSAFNSIICGKFVK